MAFEFIRSENSASPIEKELLATATTEYKHGAAIKYGASSGTAELATGTTKPDYIYVGKDFTAAAGDKLACVPVQPNLEFVAPLKASGTSLKEGQKVTVSSDSLGVTATTSSGVFQLLEPGKASGAYIRGRFV
jgi:hypothetical protein